MNRETRLGGGGGGNPVTLPAHIAGVGASKAHTAEMGNFWQLAPQDGDEVHALEGGS